MSTPELLRLHGHFATGIHDLIEQRRDEPEIDRLERELSDPETSFIGALQEVTLDVGWYDEQSGGRHTLDYGEHIDDFELSLATKSLALASEHKRSDELFTEAGSLRNVGEDGIQAYQYAALGTARQRLKQDHTMEQIKTLLATGRIAALNMPEGYEGKKPKRHKKETIDDMLFRKAVTILQDTASKRPAFFDEMKQFIDALSAMPEEKSTEYFLSVLSLSESTHLRKGVNDITMSTIAEDILDALARQQTTAESLKEEQYKLARIRNLRKEKIELGIEPETANWDILPPEALDEIERTGQTGNKEGTPDFVDPERLKWLARLAIDWGNDAYIVVSSLNNSSDAGKYYAAILPGVIDGISAEHAVAENASSGNATYAFRAERGLNQDGSIWLTWKDVLTDNKSGARALGAKKILHSKYWEENVLEYLTRPDQDLDNERYKR